MVDREELNIPFLVLEEITASKATIPRAAYQSPTTPRLHPLAMVPPQPQSIHQLTHLQTTSNSAGIQLLLQVRPQPPPT
jgi:hypothetical protein